MKRHWVGLALAAALVLGASPAWAQRGGRGGGAGFGGGLGLLAQASVQSELKLSDEQKSKVTTEVEKQRSSFGSAQGLSREERQKRFAEAAKTNNATIASILKEDQLKRFKEISLQQRGAQAIADPEVADAVGLSAEQKGKVSALQDAQRAEMRSAFQNAQGGDREENRKKFEALQKSNDEKFSAILTVEQQAKFKALQGEAFKGEIRRPQFRGNRPGAARGKGKARGSAALPSSLDLLSLITMLAPAESREEQVPEARTADQQDDKQTSADSGKPKDKNKEKGKHKGRHHARNHRRSPQGAAAHHRRPEGRDAAWDRVARAVQSRDHHRGPDQNGRPSVSPYLNAARRGHGWLGHAQVHRSWSDNERSAHRHPGHGRGNHGYAGGHRGHGHARYAHHHSPGHRGFHGRYAARGHHGHHGHHGGHGYAHHRGHRHHDAGRYAHHSRGPGHHGHHAAHHGRHGHHGPHHFAHQAHHRGHHGEHGHHGDHGLHGRHGNHGDHAHHAHHGHVGHHRLASWNRRHGPDHHGDRHHGSHGHGKRDHEKRDHEKKPEGDRKGGDK